MPVISSRYCFVQSNLLDGSLSSAARRKRAQRRNLETKTKTHVKKNNSTEAIQIAQKSHTHSTQSHTEYMVISLCLGGSRSDLYIFLFFRTFLHFLLLLLLSALEERVERRALGLCDVRDA